MNSIQEQSQKVINILLIAGAINWGLVAYNGTDIVRMFANTVSYPILDTYIKLAVGLAGIYTLFMLILKFTKRNENNIM